MLATSSSWQDVTILATKKADTTAKDLRVKKDFIRNSLRIKNIKKIEAILNDVNSANYKCNITEKLSNKQ